MLLANFFLLLFCMCAITFIGKFTCAKTHTCIIQYLTSTMREAKVGLSCHRSITASAFVRQLALRIRLFAQQNSHRFISAPIKRISTFVCHFLQHLLAQLEWSPKIKSHKLFKMSDIKIEFTFCMRRMSNPTSASLASAVYAHAGA